MNLSIESPFTIASSIALFCALILIIYFKPYKAKSKYKGNITLIKGLYIDMYDDFIKGFDSLSVTVKSQEIDTGTIYTKFFIVNTGSIDIDRAKIDSSLRLELPSSAIWEAISIKNKPTEVNFAIESEKRFCAIYFALLKQNEAIEIDAIIKLDTKHDSDFASIVNLKHRISGVDPVTKKNSLYEFSLSNIKDDLIFSSLILGLIQFMIIVFIAIDIFSTKTFETLSISEIKSPYNKYSFYSQDIVSDTTVILNSLLNEQTKKASLNDINNKNLYKTEIFNITRKPNYTYYIYGEGMILPLFLLSLFHFFRKKDVVKRIDNAIFLSN